MYPPGNHPTSDSSHLPAYFSTGEKKWEASNVESAQNIEVLIEPQPTLSKDSPVTDLERFQRDDGSAKAPELHAPGKYKHKEGVFVLSPVAELL